MQNILWQTLKGVSSRRWTTHFQLDYLVKILAIEQCIEGLLARQATLGRIDAIILAAQYAPINPRYPTLGSYL